ncbi:RNA polymerase ECF-type sigma factor [hydrothermal vent metagenome]|uniref:RNA polymerase ECF-type sigma factor n=1 Tax=hydrothermal vent metagenome TaxID=652676 RepID=A0A3B0T9P5_9ZZZZ
MNNDDLMNYQDQALLIEHLRRGEEQSFIHLVDHYNQRLYGYAMTLTNDQALSQDILQNVFLKTWEKRKKIKIKTSLQNYLFKAVHNEFVNQYKKNRSTMILEQKYFDALDRATKSYDENSFLKAIEKITEEIQSLPPKCREVFILSRKEGLTNIEISQYLNVSVKTVEAHVTKAFSILRKKLGDKIETILFMVFGLSKFKS